VAIQPDADEDEDEDEDEYEDVEEAGHEMFVYGDGSGYREGFVDGDSMTENDRTYSKSDGGDSDVKVYKVLVRAHYGAEGGEEVGDAAARSRSHMSSLARSSSVTFSDEKSNNYDFMDEPLEEDDDNDDGRRQRHFRGSLHLRC
jgi:hypothetical protein